MCAESLDIMRRTIVAEEVTRTLRLFQETFGRSCRGITGPWGDYWGLSDRPDLLRILNKAGLCWLRTHARDYRDCQPTPLEVQPFFYRDQAFPEMLEIPVQGYQDDFYWERFDDRRHGAGYVDFLNWAVEQTVEHDRVFCVNSHDHGTPTAEAFDQTKCAWLRPLLEKGRSAGARFVSCEELYQEQLQLISAT